MRILYLFLLISLVVQNGFSQKNILQACGANPDIQAIQLIHAAISLSKKEHKNTSRTLTSIPIKVWCITDSNQVPYVTEEMLQLIIEEANASFFGAHLSFFQCAQQEMIIDDQLADFTLYELSALQNQYYHAGIINLYIVNSIRNFSGDPLCGYAKFPGSSDIIMMENSCLMDGSTFIHELGHFFGLYHTHGTSNIALTSEYANGSNCTIAGDDVCDTPADPNLKNLVNPDCIYAGSLLDNNGDPYTPDVNNIMCYAPAPCRNHFSEGQIERIQYVHQHLRSYLHCDQIFAGMNITGSEGICDQVQTVSVNYSGSTENANISWDISGDTIAEYFGTSFTHTFTETGDYAITLFVDDSINQVSLYHPKAVQVFDHKTLPFEYHFNRPERHQYKILNPDEDQTWFETRLNPQSNNYCLNIDNYHNYERGEKDAFTLAPFELNAQTYAFMTFDVAYAYAGSNHDDQLEVLISLDCGLTYEQVYSKSGLDLATISEITNEQWMPATIEDWRNEYIDLTPYIGETILIQFLNINDFGNNLYIDQIILDGDEVLALSRMQLKGRKINNSTNRLQWDISDRSNLSKCWIEAGTHTDMFRELYQINLADNNSGTFDHNNLKGEAYYYRLAGYDNQGIIKYSNILYIPKASENHFQLYPNPVSSHAFLELSLLQEKLPANYFYEIYDQQGIKLQTGKGNITQSFNKIPLFFDALSAGIYFIKIMINGESYQQRFVKS